MIGAASVTARVDADPRVGLGHLRRTRTLLEELARCGSAVGIVGRFDSRVARFGAARLSQLSSPAAEPLNEVRDAEESLAAIGPADPGGSWVIVDHYGLGESWEGTVRSAGHRVLALDDLRDRVHCAEILVSDTPEPFAAELDRFPGGALQLLGAPYALLEPEFNAVEKTIPSPAVGLRLLVTFGGADPTGESAKVLQALGELPGGSLSSLGIGAIDLVVGPACGDREELSRQGSAMEGLEVHDAPSSLASLMYAADLVVTAGGNSLVEALAVGRPCLVIQTAENQARMIRWLSREDVIVALGNWREVSPGSIAAGLARLAERRMELAARLSERPVFDNRGAGRIARAMAGRAAVGWPEIG